MWHLYILRCSDNSLYTGVTTDVQRRLKDHNKGKRGSNYTRSRLPVRLVYQEPCVNRPEALKREAGIKRLPKKKKEELIIRKKKIL